MTNTARTTSQTDRGADDRLTETIDKPTPSPS